jgi:hypothetical protein
MQLIRFRMRLFLLAFGVGLGFAAPADAAD